MALISYKAIEVNNISTGGPYKVHYAENSGGSDTIYSTSNWTYTNSSTVITPTGGTFWYKPYLYVKVDTNGDILITKFGFEIKPDSKPDPTIIPETNNLYCGKRPDSRLSDVNASFTTNGSGGSGDATQVTCDVSIKTINLSTSYNVYSEFLEFVPRITNGLKIGNTSETKTLFGYISFNPGTFVYDMWINDHTISGTSDTINKFPTSSNTYYTNFSRTYTTPVETKTAVYFHNYSGNTIKYGSVMLGSYIIDNIARNLGVDVQTKPSTTSETTKYNVNFYLDSSLTSKTGTSKVVEGGSSTTSYTHREDSDHNHYWSRNKNESDPLINITLEKGIIYHFYPVFESTTTSGSLPSKLPTEGFYAAQRVGYRGPDGSKNNNTYFSAKTNAQVSRGGEISASMISGSNINLYLKWSAAKYTIRFNTGDADKWVSDSNTITTITKTYGTNIAVNDTSKGYPTTESDMNTRLIKTGYLQYGWVPGGSSVHKSGDNSICMYSYNADSHFKVVYDLNGNKRYDFTRAVINDKWYDDNLSGVDVYPCWVPIVHVLKSHYFLTSGGAEKIDQKEFTIETARVSKGLPMDKKTIDDLYKAGLRKAWSFLGWVQTNPPSGTYNGGTWKWGNPYDSTGTNPNQTIRNKGVFKYLEDLGNTKYSTTYGITRTSLTDADWNDIGGNTAADQTGHCINLYALWRVISKYVFISNNWRPVIGTWVFINDEWKWVSDLRFYSSGWHHKEIDS